MLSLFVASAQLTRDSLTVDFEARCLQRRSAGGVRRVEIREQTRRPPLWENTGFVRAGLILLSLAVWSATLANGFVTIDDPAYLTNNPVVQQGLTWAGFKWALLDISQGHWHPLAWLSLMLDVELWGRAPAGHHGSSVLLHVATTVGVFELLRRSTGSLWRSALVAAAFCVHPLRVESVAWAAERKDTLSAFFGVWALNGYVAWTRRPTVGRYATVLALFAASLMSKATFVTLPFVLLLWDFWPLRRWPGPEEGARWRVAGRRVVEKWPLFLMALVFCAVAFWVQRRVGPLLSLQGLPLGWRLETAAVGYVRYLGKFLWPSHLIFFYALSNRPPALGEALACGALMGATIVGALLLWKRLPAVTVGWLWFVGLLFPLSGIIPNGWTALADRYTYLPSIGLFVALFFGLPAPPSGWRRSTAGTACAVLLGVWSLLTLEQIEFWKSSSVLYAHALDVEPENPFVHMALGVDLEAVGDLSNAERHLRRALAGWSFLNSARVHLGTVLLAEKRPREAVPQLQRALLFEPHAELIERALAEGQEAEGNFPGAAATLRDVRQHSPHSKALSLRLGIVLGKARQYDEAAQVFREAIAREPDSADLHFNFGLTLARAGLFAAAVDELQKAVQLSPDNAEHATALTNAREDLVRSVLPTLWPVTR